MLRLCGEGEGDGVLCCVVRVRDEGDVLFGDGDGDMLFGEG